MRRILISIRLSTGTTIEGYTTVVDYSSLYASRWELPSGATLSSPATHLCMPHDGNYPPGLHHGRRLLVCVRLSTGTTRGGYACIAVYSFMYALQWERPSWATPSSLPAHLCMLLNGNDPRGLHHRRCLLICACLLAGIILRGFTTVAGYSSMYAPRWELPSRATPRSPPVPGCLILLFSALVSHI
jgi:hypothetical protein